MASAWAFRSAVRSSKPTAVAFGRRATPTTAAPSASPCRWSALRWHNRRRVCCGALSARRAGAAGTLRASAALRIHARGSRSAPGVHPDGGERALGHEGEATHPPTEAKAAVVLLRQWRLERRHAVSAERTLRREVQSGPGSDTHAKRRVRRLVDAQDERVRIIRSRLRCRDDGWRCDGGQRERPREVAPRLPDRGERRRLEGEGFAKLLPRSR